MKRAWMAIGLMLSIWALCGCDHRHEPPPVPTVSVTSTYLESAVRDLCGDTVRVACLAPPGMCPGHFDPTPGQVRRLLDSELVIRFDFQEHLEQAVRRIRDRVVSIRGRDGLCLPQTYLRTCRDLVPFLEDRLRASDGLDTRLRSLEDRMQRLSRTVQDRVEAAGLKGTPVLASYHQRAFAQWLGLRVVGTFRNAEVTTPGQIEACLAAARQGHVQLVIANLQEGTELARNVAREVGASLVVFSNFPDTGADSGPAFDRLVLSNIDRLLNPQAP